MTGAGKSFARGLVVGFVAGTAAGILLVQSPLWPLRKETRAVRDARVITMTPEQFPARCGKLISDKLTHSGFVEMFLGSSDKHVLSNERDVTVTVILPDGTPQDVTAVFDKVDHTKPRWKLSTVGGYDTGTSTLGGLKTIEELYPCTTNPP